MAIALSCSFFESRLWMKLSSLPKRIDMRKVASRKGVEERRS
jgi:hypothetical protein